MVNEETMQTMSDNTEATATEINVKTLGAIGNGLDDDTVAIQQAINNYSTIIIPEGTYRVKGLRLRSNIRIEGHNATLKIIDNDSMALNNAYTTNTVVFIAEGEVENSEIIPIHDIEISGIHFDGNASYYMGLGNGTILDVAAKFTSAGVDLQGAENVYIHNCTFEDFKNAGIYATYPTDFAYESNPTSWCVRGLTVKDCEFNKNGVPRSRISPDHQPMAKGSDTVENEYTVAAACRGIAILSAGNQSSNKDIHIERCIVHNAGEHGIVFYPLTENVTVRDCIVKNCGLYTGEEGVTYTYTDETETIIDTVSGGDYLKKLDNSMLSHSAGCNIKLNTVRNCVIENCYLYGTTSWGVSAYHRSGYPEPCNITIRNNVIEGNSEQKRMGGAVVGECGKDIKVIGNVLRNHRLNGHNYHKAYPYNTIGGNKVPVRDSYKRYYTSEAIVVLNGQVTDNVIEDCDMGISLSNGTIIGNRILCGGYGITVSQKISKDSDGNVTAVLGDGSYCVIAHNTVEKDGSVSSGGIRIGYLSAADRPCKGNRVYGNEISGFAAGVEYYAGSYMEDTFLLDNIFTNVTESYRLTAAASDVRTVTRLV